MRKLIGGTGALLFLLAPIVAPTLDAQERERDQPPAVVQPGAPGSPGTALTADDLRIPEQPRHTAADVLFMQNMIHHHHQALIMSALAPERAASDAVRRLADRIHRSQTDEIRLMRRWLELRDEEAPEVDLEADHARLALHYEHHHGHHVHDGPLMGGMLTPAQLRDLAEAEGTEFDRLFLELMIFHHEGAVEMVRELFASEGSAQGSDIFQFASHAKSDQMIEIRRMEGLLRRNPARSFTPGGDDDPRVGLEAGWKDAESAAWNMELVAHLMRPDGFRNPDDPGDGRFWNTDLAFRDDLVFVGNYNGINIYDVSDPADPVLRTSIVCPGGQGDVSVFGNLLFMSSQETRARIDCGTEGTEGTVDPERFRGVRIFDISDLDSPVQVAAVQTCRGSHTHTLVSDPNDPETIYVYNSGTSPVRPGEELEGCVPERDPDHPETSYWSIDVIEVPLAAPEDAEVIDSPRIFADPATGDIAGLWEGGPAYEEAQETRPTDRCHDITAYPEIGLAAGACSGNGLLLDISDPANPVRVDAVFDPNFAFWHSATFSNDGNTVIFTDEWGGGTQPRCLATDRPEWGANAIFRRDGGRMQLASYYKLPAPQTETENCVAHNGSLVPVPGRDIKVQAWYQGGVSVFDFTDPENPYEIAFFDRGPVDAEELMTGGYWSTYWYNGYIYGSEIARGLDVLELSPSEHLTENELEAARLVRMNEFNAQHQPRIVWPADFVVARAYLDQLVRHEGIPPDWAPEIAAELDRIEGLAEGAERRAALQELATELWAAARDVERGAKRGDADRLRALAGAVLDLAAEAR